MPEYISVFDSQGYDSVQEVMKLSWEDFEDIGVKRLGHLKRLGLAIKKLKVRPLTDISPCQNWSSMQFVPQYQQRGVPPFLTRELVFHLASGIYLDAYRQQCKTTERKTFILVFFSGKEKKRYLVQSECDEACWGRRGVSYLLEVRLDWKKQIEYKFCSDEI